MDGAVATLTVPTMVDDTAHAVVVNDGTSDLYNASVTYDKNEITEIAIETVNFNQTIGNMFTLTVKVTDEDGDVIANKEVKLEASGAYNDFEDAVVLTSTTDENGLATFEWTRNHETTWPLDDFVVFVVEKPIVRTSGSVTWTLSEQLVTLDAAAQSPETLSDESAFEFTVTAKNADGSNYVGDLILDLNVTDAAGGTATLQDTGNANIKIQVWHNNAWVNSIAPAAATAAADNELIETAATRATYEMTAADNGTKKFRIYTKDEGGLNAADIEDITVTVWYDKDNSGVAGGLTAQDPRAVTGKKSYVAGIPSITFTQRGNAQVIATTANANDEFDYVLYDLAVVDQFGNPYRGNVKLNEYAAIDNNVTTPVATNAFSFAVDSNADGIYEIAAAATQNLNTRIGQDDLDNDSVFVVKLTNTNGADTIEPTAYVDMPNDTAPADTANVLDANDVYVKADEIESQVRTIVALEVTPVETASPAAGGFYAWKVEAKDQFGTAYTNATADEELEFHLLDADGLAIDGPAVAGSGVQLYVDVNGNGVDAQGNVTVANFQEAGTDADTTTITSGTNMTVASVDVTALPFYIAIDGGAADTTYQVRVFSEAAPGVDNSTYETGEVTVLASVTYVDQVLTSGEFSAIAAKDTDTPANAADDSVVIANANFDAAYVDFTGKDGAVELTYDLKDQSDQAYDTTGGTGVQVTWTVKNLGNTQITVNDGTDKTLAAGETGIYTTTSSVAAASKATLYIVGTAEGKVEVSAQAAGVEQADTASIYFTENLIFPLNADSTYNGTVVAFDKTANWLILNTTVGYIVVEDYDASVAPPNTAAFKVDGNTANITQFEDNLTVGDTLVVENDYTAGAPATNDLTLTLTNN